jgi:hypothetical protein
VWENIAFRSRPFYIGSSDFESKYGIPDHEYHRSLVEQRSVDPFTGSIWDYGSTGGSHNEYHFVNGVAVCMTSYNLWEGGGGKINRYDFGTQQKGPYDDDLAEFVHFYFGDELNELNKMGKVTWWVDGKLKYTTPSRPGDTMPLDDDKRAAISLNPIVFTDARILYVTVAHELVHARDILNGNRKAWLGWYEDRVTKTIMEHHAYLRSLEIEKGFGVPMGSRTGLVLYQLPYEFNPSLYKW